MRGKERMLVALVLAAALAAGLYTVNRALARDRQAAEAWVAEARAAREAEEAAGAPAASQLPAVPEVALPRPSSGDAAQPDAAGDETDAPQASAGAEGEELSEEAPGEGAAGEGAALESVLAAGNFSDPQVLRALGLLDEENMPSMGSGEVTLESLTDWMVTQSLDARAAQAALQLAQAVASGAGSADDAARRAFAASQGEANYQAELNRLKEEAMELGLTYLRWAALAELLREDLAFYEAMAQGTAKAQEENGFREKLEQTLTQVSSDLAQAEQELAAAAQRINQAVGNPADTPMVVTGELTAPPPPALTEEEAVAGALAGRNELKGAAYDIIRAEQQLTRLRYQYAANAPEVLEQQAVLTAAQAAHPALSQEIEREVREVFDRLRRTQEQVEQAEAALESLGGEGLKVAYVVEDADGDGWTEAADTLLARRTQYTQATRQRLLGLAELSLEGLWLEHAAGAGTATAEIG